MKNDCIQSILSLFPSAEMGQHSNYLHGNKATSMRLFIDSFFLQYNSIFNLCHFSMTPLRTITQHINDAPYTTPAKRGSKIGARAYCRNVISGRGLFRLDLNGGLQIADYHFLCKQVCSVHLEKQLIFDENYYTIMCEY